MEDESPSEIEVDRGTIVRDAITFQVKLALDGLIDLIMLPVSMVAAIISLVQRDDTFYRAVKAGGELDQRLNLWGGSRPSSEETDDPIESLALRIDGEIRKEIREGKLQSSAREVFSEVSKKMNEM